MARAIQDGRLTPADELRALLAESEKLLVNLRGDGSNALQLLRNMDRVTELWPELEASGADLRAEAGRWDTLQGAVRGSAPHIVRQFRRLGGLSVRRAEDHPDGQEKWWWRLDHEVAARARSRLLRFGIIALAIIALLVAAGLVLNNLFPVDPRVQEAAGKIMAGQSKIQNEADFAAALPLFEEAASLTPGDSEAWLWLGATQEKLGEGAASAESFRKASELTPDQTDYRTRRAMVYLVLGVLDRAESESEAALALDPGNPQVHLILAGVLDARGQYFEAAQELQKAADFADQRNQPQISATARYQLGVLLQRMPVIPQASPTPAPP